MTVPKLTPEERRRRKARRAWIPTAVIGGLIAIAIVIAIVVQSSGSGKPVVEHAGDTNFTKAGIAEVTKTADAQIDVRGPRQASIVSLPANGSKTFGPFNGIAAELDLVGSHGIDSVFVDSFTVTTRNDYLRSITTQSREFDFADLHNQLDAEAVLGITNAQMARFENAMPVGAGGPTSFFRLDVGTGHDLGVPTAISVVCAGPKGCDVRTVTTLAQP